MSAEPQDEVTSPTTSSPCTTPSCVVHFRNVTPDITRSELKTHCERNTKGNGCVKNVVILRFRNQGLVEFDTVETAQLYMAGCDHRHDGSRLMGSKRIYAHYSYHTSLSRSICEGSTKVLLVSMFNPMYNIADYVNITPQVVYFIFSSTCIQKVVVLTKPDIAGVGGSLHQRINAFIQMRDEDGAEAVLRDYQGHIVHLGNHVHLMLEIQPSKHNELKCTNPYNYLEVPGYFNPQQSKPRDEDNQQQEERKKVSSSSGAMPWMYLAPVLMAPPTQDASPETTQTSDGA